MCKSNLLSFWIFFKHWKIINITESVCIFLNEIKSLTKFVSDLSCKVCSSVFLISDEEDCISWLKSCKVFDFSLEFFWNKFINWSLVASVFKNLKVTKSAHTDSCSELKKLLMLSL